jgi:Phage integrase, N-terminal SAM-like domain
LQEAARTNQLVAFTDRIPALVAAAGERTSYRFFEFFTAQIRNPNTRRANVRAAVEFFDWLAARRVTQITAIESVHIAAYIEQLQQARSAPTAKLRLADLRHLFDWMVIGQIMPLNPAAAVRGPRYIVRRGKTPVLDPGEARQLHSPPRPCLDWAYGLFLRTHRRGDRPARRRRVSAEPAGSGCACTRRQATCHALPSQSRSHEYLDGAGLANEPKAMLTAVRPASSPAIPCPRRMPMR